MWNGTWQIVSNLKANQILDSLTLLVLKEGIEKKEENKVEKSDSKL